jgi:hypothetical protein|tara:strand:+ start:1538 stop:1696 length:159 start_codon:yes stop_codon:yes gene_type:complete
MKKIMKKKATGWSINIQWEREDGTWYVEDVADMPNDVSSVVDSYITELEEKE